ncbi:uncharacterized protein LOC141911003 [Tubulanus polymorphus]|uniref:uncharacterized protein LOC141911003 n=1 Tax=Tubulanus polymorphus TaxID=672921 RepID=UPI003DA667F5
MVRNIVALIVVSIIWVNATDNEVSEEQLNGGNIEAVKRVHVRHEEQWKRYLSNDFENKHFMTTYEFQQLATNQEHWDIEMTRRLHFYDNDPAVIQLIVAKDYFRLQNDVAKEGNKIGGGNVYETRNRYRVYDVSIRVLLRGGRRRAVVTRLIDRGVVHLILGYNPNITTMTMHFKRIVGPGRNRQIHLHQ